MFLGTSFGKTVDILHRTMDVSLLRRQVIANNMANADTPNFKRTVVNYESELARALESERVTGLEAKMTNTRHIPFQRPTNYRDVQPRRVLDYLTTAKNNGNNVDPEQELNNAMHNQLMYTLMSDALNNRFARVNLVLR
jgi:flagellar basal-body rod protein FlgB